MVETSKVLERIRVLIVDDHAGVAESIGRVLALDHDLDLIGVESTAIEGLDRAARDNPDIVLMDFALPDMTGAEAMKAVQPRIRVIGMTASDEPGSYAKSVNAGISAWVLKKDAVWDLREAIHRVHPGERLLPDDPGVNGSQTEALSRHLS